MTARSILLVPGIHFINFPVFLLLSFVYDIKTLKIRLPRFYPFRKRIELIRLEDYFTWEEYIVMSEDVVKVWEKALPEFPETAGKIHINKFNLDMSIKAKQDTQKEFENLFLLKGIIAYFENRNKHNIYMVDSIYFNFVKSFCKNKEFSYPNIRFLSSISIMLDLFFLYILNLSIGLKRTVQLIYGLLKKKNIKQDLSKIKYIWDGISPRELSVDEDKNTFKWIIDDNTIRKEEVLFLLPKADFQMKDFSEDEAKRKGLLIADHFNMVCLAPAGPLLSSLYKVLKITLKNMIVPPFSLRGIWNIKYTLQILNWFPLVEGLKLKVYVTSLSTIGSENPAIIYFQNAGIKTVMWAYGTNAYFFTTHNKKCDFRNIIFCNILSSTLVAWNKHFKKFIEAHVQENLEIKVIGPLMCGDESIFNVNPKILRKKIGINHIHNNSFKYIAIFDAPPVSKAFIGSQSVCPDSNSEEYNYAFIRDVVRLLSDFENIFLLYKPKRSLISGKFAYSDEMKIIFEELHKSARAIILDYNIDPWLPIASADMSISMPFESTFIASVHYGKPTLFHDPLNIAQHHRYQEIPEYISHSYDELKFKVDRWIATLNNRSVIEESVLNLFAGICPGTNSTNRFREYLLSLSRTA